VTRVPPETYPTPIGSVEELLDVLARGAHHHDEPDVDLLSHGLQCAARLAETHPDDVELQVAGLVHDLAGAVDPDAAHDRLGAHLVAPLLGERVARLVGGHVAAKRYLVATDPAYADCLTARSVDTLAWQGGPADEAVLAAVEASPDRDALLALRRADDGAKDPAVRPPGLDTWSGVLARVAARSPERGGQPL
jgi:predicted HD phosphohydrolase